MKYKIKELKVPYAATPLEIKEAAAVRMGISAEGIAEIKIINESIDARKKNNIIKVLTLSVDTKQIIIFSDSEIYTPPQRLITDLKLTQKKSDKRVFIAGSGPAGIFCALTLTRLGIKCVVLERGLDVDGRDAEVEKLKKFGLLNQSCNIQFGEGGAGTYSDGKLNTGKHDSLISVVLGEFAEHGAPPDIESNSKPHIGTDYLKKVVKALRNDIKEGGSEVRFGNKLNDITVKGGKLCAIEIEGKTTYCEDCDILVLAVGHSARDTFKMLSCRGIKMEKKPFSMGVRIEHLQSDVDISQYGNQYSLLPPADYKHSFKLDNGRGVYTFCMCPGGEVVCAATEEGMLATNGMSEFVRDKRNANSAVLVSVTPADFAGDDPLAGIEFQRKYERLAYNLGGGEYKAPIQRLDDFINGKVTADFGRVKPSYLPNTSFADLRGCMPLFVYEGIKAGVGVFGKKMRGFDAGDSILTGIETRSSSPVRIVRDEKSESSIKGVYPCGEGAGYAGGITSSAVDGIKTALKIYEML